MTREASPVPARAAWRTVVTLAVVYAISVFNRQILTILITPIKADLDLDYVQVGVLLGTAFGISYILGSVVIGNLVDRVPRRPILVTTLTATALATIAAGLSPVYGGLLAGRVMLGAVQSALPPASHSMLGDSFSRDRATLPLAIFSLGAPVGISASLMFGGLFLEWAQARAQGAFLWLDPLRPWQLVLLVTGVASLAATLLVLTLREPARARIGQATDAAATTGDLLAFLGTHKLLFACHFGLFALSTLVSVNMVFWSPQHMHQRFGWSFAEIGATLAAVSLVGSVSSGLLGGYVSDVMYRRGYLDAPVRISLWSFLVALPFTALAFLTASPALFLVSFLIVFSVTQNQGLASVALQLVTPARMRGRLSAIYLSAVTAVSMGVGPTLIGALTQYVFVGEGRLAMSLLTVLLSCMAAAVAIALVALKPMRAGVRDLADDASVRPQSA